MAVAANIGKGHVRGLSSLETRQGGDTHLRGRHTGGLLSKRYELVWVPGEHAIPSVAGDLTNAAEAVRNTANRLFIILGTNATSDDATIYVEGGITMTTSGADADEIIIAPHTDTQETGWEIVTWGTDQETEWEAVIQTGAAITNCAIWAGLKLQELDVVATDADQVFFRYESGVNSGKWEAVSSIGGTDSQSDSGVLAVTTDTTYHLKITIDIDRVARMYIDDVLVKTTAALTDAIDLKPFIGVGERGGSAARVMRVFGQAISRKYGA